MKGYGGGVVWSSMMQCDLKWCEAKAKLMSMSIVGSAEISKVGGNSSLLIKIYTRYFKKVLWSWPCQPITETHWKLTICCNPTFCPCDLFFGSVLLHGVISALTNTMCSMTTPHATLPHSAWCAIDRPQAEDHWRLLKVAKCSKSTKRLQKSAKYHKISQNERKISQKVTKGHIYWITKCRVSAHRAGAGSSTDETYCSHWSINVMNEHIGWTQWDESSWTGVTTFLTRYWEASHNHWENLHS